MRRSDTAGFIYGERSGYRRPPKRSKDRYKALTAFKNNLDKEGLLSAYFNDRPTTESKNHKEAERSFFNLNPDLINHKDNPYIDAKVSEYASEQSCFANCAHYHRSILRFIHDRLLREGANSLL